MRGIQLRARTALRSGRGRWLVPPWIAPAFFLCALILIVWAASTTAELVQAALEAALVELPLAALCFWMA